MAEHIARREYVRPEIELHDFAVEQGFAVSGIPAPELLPRSSIKDMEFITLDEV